MASRMSLGIIQPTVVIIPGCAGRGLALGKKPASLAA